MNPNPKATVNHLSEKIKAQIKPIKVKATKKGL
jgi:hypothetical protein